jgi:hypothetical protein
MTVDPHGEHTASWLLRWSRMQLDRESPQVELGPPPAGVRDARPATVILTIFDGHAASGFSGQGGGLLEATMSAVAGALAAAPTTRRLQVDIVSDEPIALALPSSDGKLSDPDARASWHRLTTWQDGLVVEREGATHWLVPTQLLLQGMARGDRGEDATAPTDVLAAAMSQLGLPDRAWRDPGLALRRFQTSAWIESATHERALPIVQGVIPAERVDRDVLMASALAGGEYLMRTQRDDGSFTYVLDPWLKTQSRSAYNIVRHAGTAAALFELVSATGDRRFLRPAFRAMEHLAGWYRPGAQDGLTYVLDKDGKAKLGALGLALLALSRKLELMPESADRERALQLGRQIVSMQHPDGSFESYLRIRGNEPSGSVSLYYPGEAMLGLARVARLGLDDGFMAAAHRGADYLIASRQGRTRLPPDAWLIQALDVLHADDPKQAYVEHAIAISQSMLADQYGPDAAPSFVGGFGSEPIRSTRTTARVEGIVAGFRLAERAGDGRAAGLLAALRRTAPHLVTMQYGPDNSFFLDEPEAVRGAIRGGLDDAEIRIDYVQHYISAVLGLAALA